MQLKPSSTLDDNKYREYIRNDRDIVSKVEEIKEIHNKWFKGHYTY